MKIVFLARSLDYGGAERQLSLLAPGLARRGHDVRVAVFYAGGPLARPLEDAGVRVVDLEKHGRWSMGRFVPRLIRLVRGFAPDVLHGYLPVPNILCAALKPLLPRGARVVFGIRASNMDLSRYDRLSALSYRLETWMARTADLVICNSEAGLRTMVDRGIPEARCAVIPNGVDTHHFRPDSHARRELRAEWHIDEGERLVGLVGRLDPKKGHEMFLEAAARLAGRRGDVRFLCVGDGPGDLRRALEARAVRLGIGDRVIWAQARDDVAGVYNALDLLVSASIYGEGFPNVLAEAMACGTPVVATDVGDSAKVAGDPGRIVPPGDPEVLALAIEKSLDNPPEGRRGHIDRLFGTQVLVETTERALSALISDGSHP